MQAVPFAKIVIDYNYNNNNYYYYYYYYVV